jgi:SPOR domain
MQAFGIMRLSLALGLSLGIWAGAAAGPETAFAQSSEAGIAALSRALSAYDSGDYANASASIDEAFKGGLSKEFSARAILLRAQINERNGALARALQDYSNALFMDTLPPSEKKKAADGKQRVIAAMGLNTPAAPAEDASVRQVSKPAGGSGPAVAQAAPEKSSGGILGMFDGLFGSSKPKAEPAPAQAPAQEPKASWQTASAAPPASSASPVVSASPVQTRPRDQTGVQAGDTAAARKTARAEKSPPARPKAVTDASYQPVSMTPAAAANGFLIVFGPASSEAAGRSKAQQIKAQVADILVSRELDVEANSAGGYRIVAGPYKAKGSALALCSAMKQRGVPCEVTP